MIEVQNISFKYPGARVHIIHDVSFHVMAGEIFGFLGPSGAGKSTLQKMLTKVLRDYSGTVRVFDKEVKKRDSTYYCGGV